VKIKKGTGVLLLYLIIEEEKYCKVSKLFAITNAQRFLT